MLNVEYLTVEEFEQLPKFRGLNSIRIKDDNLYKWIIKVKLSYVEYLASLDRIHGLVLPESTFTNGSFFNGYVSKYINGSLNITEYISESNPFSINKAACFKQILKLVEIANHYFIIGDFRNSNVLITPKEPFLIDFDNGKKLNDPLPLSTSYGIICEDFAVPESILSDRIKALISALTIYYNLDFETYATDHDIIDLAEILENMKVSKDILEYLDYLINQAINENYDSLKSFEIFIRNLKPASKKENIRLLTRF